MRLTSARKLLTNRWLIAGQALVMSAVLLAPLAGGQSKPSTAPSATPTPGAPATGMSPRSSQEYARHQPPSEPSAPSTFIQAPPPIPASFDVLLDRSIFIKGRQRTGGYENTYVPPPVYTPRAEAPQYVLVGMLGEGPAYVAFIENRTSGNVSRAKVGDTLVNGAKVSAITIDYLEYRSGTRTVRIYVGQTLSGEMAAAPAPTTQSAAAATTAPATGNPQVDAVIARLKARRAAEQAH